MVTDDHQGAPLLTASGVVKHFPGAKALDGVDLDVYPGEVHCLLGQNGAGKSTLIKVLAGAHKPDAGVITWQGQEVSFATPVAALRAGIATMYQELDVVDGLTVAENIFLGNEVSVAGFTQRSAVHARTREVLKRLGHSNISPTTEVEQLSAAGRPFWLHLDLDVLDEVVFPATDYLMPNGLDLDQLRHGHARVLQDLWHSGHPWPFVY